MTETDAQRVGQLNGKWSILFRALLISAGILIPIGIPMFASMQWWYISQLSKMTASQDVQNVKIINIQEDIEEIEQHQHEIRATLSAVEKDLTTFIAKSPVLESSIDVVRQKTNAIRDSLTEHKERLKNIEDQLQDL